MNGKLNRRRFLQTTAAAAAAATTKGQSRTLAIVIDPADPVASSGPARWAAGELERALADRGVQVRVYANAAQARESALRIVSAGMASPAASAALKTAGARTEAVPEALALCQAEEAVWACGHDPRGLTYALLELAARARRGGDPLAALAAPRVVAEPPANTIRSVT